MENENKGMNGTKVDLGTELRGPDEAVTTNNVSDEQKVEEPEHMEQLSTEELLERTKGEAKELEAKLKKEKEENKLHAKKSRLLRDAVLEKETIVLKQIKTLIFGYNKLGKVEKIKHDVVGRIQNICNSYQTEIEVNKETDE